MLNRRSFVQSLGAGAVGLMALEQSAETFAQSAAPARQGRPDMSSLIRIGSNENPYGPTSAALDAARLAAAEGNRYGGGGTAGALAPVLATLHIVPANRPSRARHTAGKLAQLTSRRCLFAQ